MKRVCHFSWGMIILPGLLLLSACTMPGRAPQQQEALPVVTITLPSSLFATSTEIVLAPLVTNTAMLLSSPTSELVTATTTPTPTKMVTASPFMGEHVVLRGETLYSIGRAYGVEPLAIAQANGIASPYTIYVGATLKIPRAPWSSIPAGPVAQPQFTAEYTGQPWSTSLAATWSPAQKTKYAASWVPSR